MFDFFLLFEAKNSHVHLWDLHLVKDVHELLLADNLLFWIYVRLRFFRWLGWNWSDGIVGNIFCLCRMEIKLLSRVRSVNFYRLPWSLAPRYHLETLAVSKLRDERASWSVQSHFFSAYVSDERKSLASHGFLLVNLILHPLVAFRLIQHLRCWFNFGLQLSVFSLQYQLLFPFSRKSLVSDC